MYIFQNSFAISHPIVYIDYRVRIAIIFTDPLNKIEFTIVQMPYIYLKRTNKLIVTAVLTLWVYVLRLRYFARLGKCVICNMYSAYFSNFEEEASTLPPVLIGLIASF